MSEILINHGQRNEDRGLTISILQEINKAQHWIKACNLFFDDLSVKDALLKAVERGVAIFLLTNLGGTTRRITINAKTQKKNPDEQTIQALNHAESLIELNELGAHISGLDGLHAKFLLTDSGSGLVTSANFTHNSTRKIGEIGLKIEEAEFDELEELFDYIFLRADRVRFKSHGSHFTHEKVMDPLDSDLLPANSRIRMTLAPTRYSSGFALSKAHRFDLRDEIFSIIDDTQAGDDLYLLTYSITKRMTGPGNTTLEKALKSAQKRGVKIKIVKRGGETEKENDNKKHLYISGIPFKYHHDNHAKAIVSSDRGIIFTGNFTDDSMQGGFDIGVVLNDDEISQAKDFIIRLINESI